ncbi:regulator of protease activity HflC (stomatin/prohibitin superfamily) [Rhodobacteraceae bacterium MBR-64]|jgi:hypothetical protein
MAEIIRLRAEKKQRDRAKKRAQADANAVKFGQTKAEKAQAAARAQKSARDLDGHRRDGTEAPPRGDA